MATLTADCGIERRPDGKVVWFLVNGPPTPQMDAEAALAAWDVGDLTAVNAVPASQVRLLNAPPRLWLAAREHHDALIRESSLGSFEHPGRLTFEQFADVDRARGWVSEAVVAVVEGRGVSLREWAQYSMALSGLPDTVNLTLAVDDDAATVFATSQDVLDLGERLAVEGQLFVRPGLPEIVTVRNWACEQGITQAAGPAPYPWPGTARDAFSPRGARA